MRRIVNCNQGVCVNHIFGIPDSTLSDTDRYIQPGGIMSVSLGYSGRFTHINGYPSAAGPVQTSESSPFRDRRSTTEQPNQELGFNPPNPPPRQFKRSPCVFSLVTATTCHVHSVMQMDPYPQFCYCIQCRTVAFAAHFLDFTAQAFSMSFYMKMKSWLSTLHAAKAPFNDLKLQYHLQATRLLRKCINVYNVTACRKRPV